MSIRDQIIQLVRGDALTQEQAAAAMDEIMSGVATPAQIAAFLTALHLKGESEAEIAGMAQVMREKAVPVHADGPVLDTCGTGGDATGTFNISTTAAFVAAGAGAVVAKHGNRAMSSVCGSADVLEGLGVQIELDAEGVARCLREAGIGFMFAQKFHPAMRYVGPVRREIGIRTVFNVLGPLTNPAAPPFGLIGAFDLPTARLMAEALAGMPISRCFVVHGEPGWDEATPCGPFTLFDVQPGRVWRQRRDPVRYGITPCTPAGLAGGDAAANAEALEAVLSGRDRGPHREALVLGAGLVLELTGRRRGLRRGVEAARRALDAGAGAALLERLRRFRGSAP